ncbi:hypothetical protein GC173_10395 [bacterium]|nr:hypothetical protein [bacterium]
MLMSRKVLGAATVCTLLIAGATEARDAVLLRGHSGEVVPASSLPKFTGGSGQKLTIPGGPTFNITYDDGAGVGFNDATHGANRKAVVDAVLTYIGERLDHTGTCDVVFETSQSDGTGFLASAGTLYFVGENDYAGGFAFDHLTTGTDPDGGSADIYCTVDFGYTWNNDTGPVGPGEFDLYSTLLHEMTHGLGIASLTNSDGTSQIAGTRTSYDNLLFQISGDVKVWAAGPGSMNFQASSLNGGTNTVEFRGAQSIADYAGGATFPRVDTPAVFAAGSSVSHFQSPNSITSGSPTPEATVMQRSTPPNTERREFVAFELGALEDLGYTIKNTSSSRDWLMY